MIIFYDFRSRGAMMRTKMHEGDTHKSSTFG